MGSAGSGSWSFGGAPVKTNSNMSKVELEQKIRFLKEQIETTKKSLNVSQRVYNRRFK